MSDPYLQLILLFLFPLGLLLGAGIYTVLIEPRRLVIRRVLVRSAAWRTEPLRIGIISDIHAAWPFMDSRRVLEIAEAMAGLEPELVLLPGDFATTHTAVVRPRPIEPVARALARLAASTPTYAVLGNHDHYAGAGRIVGALASVGIRTLRNEALRLAHGGRAFWLVGIDDHWTGHADAEGALRDVDPSDPLIVLTHVPDVVLRVPRGVSVTIAGHTHGGQVRLPGIGALNTASDLPRETVRGLSSVEGRTLYVSAGVGVTSLPIRFCCPPEITLLTLARA